MLLCLSMGAIFQIWHIRMLILSINVLLECNTIYKYGHAGVI